MAVLEPFEWQEDAWRELTLSGRQLPQGLMLTGVKGLGKLDFAINLAAWLLCTESTGQSACGRCTNCHALLAASHPDLHLLTTEHHAEDLPEHLAALAARYLGERTTKRPSQQISVDAIRALIENVSTHSGFGGERIVVIAPASAMNVNAANALLKILEEPPENCRFILICSDVSSLPATIFSRVSKYRMSTPALQQTLHWLQSQGVEGGELTEIVNLANGAPLESLKLCNEGWQGKTPIWRKTLVGLLQRKIDAVQAAEQLSSDAKAFLYWLERLLADLISFRHGRLDESLLVKPDKLGGFLVSELYSRQLWDMMYGLQVFRQRQQRVIDEQLFLEDTLIAIQQKV